MQSRLDAALNYFGQAIHKEYNAESELLENATLLFTLLGKEAVLVRQAAATTNGVSDLIVCYKGSFYAIELKAKNGVPSKQQEKFIDKVLLAGGAAKVCYTLADIISLLTT